jgi:hypothetical protein
LPDGTFKKPYVESKNIDFAHIVKTHKMPERFMQSGGKGLIGGRLMDYTPENLLKYADDRWYVETGWRAHCHTLWRSDF